MLREVALVRARGLPAMDRELSGARTSDPLVSLALSARGGAVRAAKPAWTSSVRHNTLNPVWHEVRRGVVVVVVVVGVARAAAGACVVRLNAVGMDRGSRAPCACLS